MWWRLSPVASVTTSVRTREQLLTSAATSGEMRDDRSGLSSVGKPSVHGLTCMDTRGGIGDVG